MLNPQFSTDHTRHCQTFIEICQLLQEEQVYGDKDMASESGSKLGSCSICPSDVFHSATEKQRHFSIFHYDYKLEQSIKRIKSEHHYNFKTTTGECTLSFPSLKTLQDHRKLKNHPVESKGTPNQ